MITRDELLKGQELAPEHEENFEELYTLINEFRRFYGRPMIVTSGYRSKEKQLEIYKGKDYVPMGSKHLSAQAVDIYDPNWVLKDFIKDNINNPIMDNFWFESFDYTPTWTHIQISPPKSGKKFFIP